MKNKANYGEMLRHENEITKLKIQAEFGIELNGSGELNPAIENIWLNQILEYERCALNNKRITVLEFLGNPSFKSIEEIKEAELPDELHTIMELLRRHNMVIESVNGIDDFEMYRFITQELFYSETDSVVPKNMIVCFIYEEFHPNAEADIRKYAKEFINRMTDKEDEFYGMYLYGDMDDDEKQTVFLRLKHRLELFREAFDEINLEVFEITSVTIHEKNADVIFEYRIAVLPPEGKKFQLISGTGKFIFADTDTGWNIEGIEMKGVV